MDLGWFENAVENYMKQFNVDEETAILAVEEFAYEMEKDFYGRM